MNTNIPEVEALGRVIEWHDAFHLWKENMFRQPGHWANVDRYPTMGGPVALGILLAMRHPEWAQAWSQIFEEADALLPAERERAAAAAVAMIVEELPVEREVPR